MSAPTDAGGAVSEAARRLRLVTNGNQVEKVYRKEGFVYPETTFRGDLRAVLAALTPAPQAEGEEVFDGPDGALFHRLKGREGDPDAVEAAHRMSELEAEIEEAARIVEQQSPDPNAEWALGRSLNDLFAAKEEPAPQAEVGGAPRPRLFPHDFAPAYQTVAHGGLTLPAGPLPAVRTPPGRHADPAAFAVNLSATIDEDAEACGICDVVFITGDRCITDITLGPVHYACCGPEREGFVNLETGEPIPDDQPLPTGWIWNGDGSISPAGAVA